MNQSIRDQINENGQCTVKYYYIHSDAPLWFGGILVIASAIIIAIILGKNNIGKVLK